MNEEEEEEITTIEHGPRGAVYSIDPDTSGDQRINAISILITLFNSLFGSSDHFTDEMIEVNTEAIVKAFMLLGVTHEEYCAAVDQSDALADRIKAKSAEQIQQDSKLN